MASPRRAHCHDDKMLERAMSGQTKNARPATEGLTNLTSALRRCYPNPWKLQPFREWQNATYHSKAPRAKVSL